MDDPDTSSPRSDSLIALSALYEATRAIGMSTDLDTLLDSVSQSAEKLIGFEHWAVLLLDPVRRTLCVRAIRGEGWEPGSLGREVSVNQGLTGWAVRNRRSVRVGDVTRDPRYLPGLAGARSNVVVPLIVGAEVVGALTAESRRPHAFTREHEKLLTVLGSQTALAVVASRATERLHLRLLELDALFRISRLTSSGRSLEWVLEQMVEVIAELLSDGRCAILLYEEEAGVLRVAAQRGYRTEVAGMTILAGQGVTGRCAESADIVIAHDLATEPSYIPGASGTGSEIALPLISEGKVVGVLDAESTEPNAFPPEVVRLLTIVARQAATVIQATQWFREVARLASTDPLTSLANRRRFLQELHRAVRRSVRYSEHFSVVLFDLDHFKAINDARGHEVGDRVLVEVARVLTEGLRDCDVVARLGGEELGALLPETTAEAALVAAERLRGQVEAIQVPLEDGDTVCVTVSVGIAAFPEHGRDERVLLNTADSALYAAKRSGRNRVVVAPALS